MLNKLGETLVKCSLHCDGINKNPTAGIIPRCLILERRKGHNTSIVVGLNPGKCNNNEREYYTNKGIEYASIVSYFYESGLNNRAYFKRTRNVIKLLGFDGDILWTDLAKCECLGENGTIPIQTLRVCIDRFLNKEIRFFNSSTIFALGNVAFEFCALSFPKHFVVGIPHPTGSYGDFNKLMERIIANAQYFVKKISDKRDCDGNYKALNLSKV